MLIVNYHTSTAIHEQLDGELYSFFRLSKYVNLIREYKFFDCIIRIRTNGETQILYYYELVFLG